MCVVAVVKCSAHPDHEATDFVVLYERPVLHRFWKGSVCKECLKGALEMLAGQPTAGPKLLIQRIGEEAV